VQRALLRADNLDQVNDDDTQLNGAAAQTSFSSGVNDGVSEATTMTGGGKENNEGSSTNTLGGLGMPFTDFKTPCDSSCYFPN
jgi:DnaJ family protein C protein 7